MKSLLQENKKLLIFCGLLVIASFPVLFGIFHPGFFTSDDGNWMVIRLSAFYEALRQGQFPVRYLPRLNNNLGYPVADFLYPLFMYVGSLIHLFHIPFITTIKILFGLSLLGGGIGIFVWLNKKFGNIAAFVGAVVYMLFPYHIWDITKRGSLGEVIALGIVPFIFWKIDGGNIILTSLGIGLLIMAHNTLALLFLPVILSYFILLRKYREMIFATIIGLGISAFFWFPALFDKQFTVFDKTVVSNFSQYFLLSDLYALIGVVSFVIIFLSLYLFVKKQNIFSAFFLVITLLSISLTTQVSKIIWQLLHFGPYVQFPFRFLSITALGVGFLTAYVIGNWKKEQRFILAGLLIVLVYICTWQYVFPKSYQYYPDTFYSTNQDTTTVQNEYMPIWVQKLPTNVQRKVSINNGNIQNITDKGGSIQFDIETSQSSKVTIAKVYFPGWIAKIDGKKTSVTPERRTGFIVLQVMKGKHHIVLYFGETTQRLIADIISLGFLIVAIGLIIKQRKKI